MTESFKQQLQELIDRAAENIDQDAYPHESFKQGCEFLIPVLMKAVEQRNEWSAFAGEYLVEKHLPSDNKELLQLLKGEK